MNELLPTLNRRDFLRGAATAAVASAVGLPSWSDETPAPRSRVVLVRDSEVLDQAGKPDPAVLRKMLDRAIAALTGEADPAAGWRRFFAPEDTVGIKSNVWRFLPTPPALEEAIRERVTGAGIPAARIGVDDRGVLDNPLFQKATALINVRPLRTHHWSGVGSLIKNYIMFDRQPARWHDDACADLAGVWHLPPVMGRTRLNILVMLTPLFHSVGPHDFNARYTWPYRGLLAGTDPVAVDSVGLSILEAQRRVHFGKDEPFPVSPKHIRVAAEKYKLGVADLSRIDLKTVGWSEGLLIS